MNSNEDQPSLDVPWSTPLSVRKWYASIKQNVILPQLYFCFPPATGHSCDFSSDLPCDYLKSLMKFPCYVRLQCLTCAESKLNFRVPVLEAMVFLQPRTHWW